MTNKIPDLLDLVELWATDLKGILTKRGTGYVYGHEVPTIKFYDLNRTYTRLPGKHVWLLTVSATCAWTDDVRPDAGLRPEDPEYFQKLGAILGQERSKYVEHR